MPLWRRLAQRTADWLLLKGATPVRRLLLIAGRERAPRLPELVQIEATNLCNARCVHCPRDRVTREQGIMGMALFRRIVDDAASLGIPRVKLHFYGEPLIDRRIADKVRYAKSRGVPEVWFTSNGSLLDEAAARALVEAGLDSLTVSMDAASSETYERIHPGLRYDRVFANIEALVRIRGEAGGTRPKLTLSFVRQPGSESDRVFAAKWGSVADWLEFDDAHNWTGALGGRPCVRFPCYKPWLNFTVLWDGRVALCCADFDGRVIVGDVRVSSITEVWNGEAFRAARRAHLESRGPAICSGCDLPKRDSPRWVRKLAGPLHARPPIGTGA